MTEYITPKQIAGLSDAGWDKLTSYLIKYITYEDIVKISENEFDRKKQIDLIGRSFADWSIFHHKDGRRMVDCFWKHFKKVLETK